MTNKVKTIVNTEITDKAVNSLFLIFSFIWNRQIVLLDIPLKGWTIT
jgi:hypothetical protein